MDRGPRRRAAGTSRPPRRRSRPAVAAVALASVAVALAPATARGGDPATADGPPGLRLAPPELPGAAPPGPTPWRAVVEEAAILGVAMVGYALTRPPATAAYAVPVLDKVLLRPGAWGYDADSLPTNYVGHPVAGMYFHQVARANRLGVGTSLGYTLASAWVWELAEYQEFLSAHDVVSTTAGGVALGEATGQLATWLGQRGGTASRAFAFLLQIPRAYHDRVDGVPPRPPVRWAREDVAAWGAGAVSWPRPSGAGAELRIGGRARLLRSEAAGEPGAGWTPLLDGNVTSLAAELAVGGPGLAGAEVLALSSLAGLHGRDLDAAGDGLDLLATLSFGFDYLRRAEPVEGRWANDYLALVRTPGVELVTGLRRGELRAELGLEAALTLGAVQPLALLGRPSDVPGAPGALRLAGYYHGLGALLAPRASLELGRVAAAASFRLDRLRAIHGHDVSPPPDGGRLALEDERRAIEVEVAWRPLAGPARLVASWERRDRWGRAGGATASLRDSTVSLALSL